MLTTLLIQVFSESAMIVWLPWFASAMVFVAGLLFKGRLDSKSALLHAGLSIASAAMNTIAPKTANTVDDKVAFGLKTLNDYFNAHGQTLQPVDEAKAKALFVALHPAPVPEAK